MRREAGPGQVKSSQEKRNWKVLDSCPDPSRRVQSLFLLILPPNTKPLPALSTSISWVPPGREVAQGKLLVREQMSCQMDVGESVQCLC